MRLSANPPNRRVRPSVEIVDAEAIVRPRKGRAKAARDEADAPPAAESEKVPSAPKRKPKKPKRARGWLQRLSLVTGAVVVLSASVAVAWGLHHYLRSSPRFSVRHVVVTGNQRHTPQQIVKRGGIDVGSNVFNIDEGQAAARIAADPWVASAEVSVDLPSRVTIDVVEREARALAAIGGRLYLVDTDGELFKELGDGDPDDLVVVTGPTAEDISRDREQVKARMRQALALTQDLERSKLLERYPLQEIHLRADRTVEATIGSDGIVLSLGLPPYRQKIAKADRILEELRFRKMQRAVLFLDNQAHPERVVVRMTGGASKGAP